MRIGVHVSIAGHIYESLERAKALGCNAMQIFSRNPRGWEAARLEEKEVAEFRRLKKAYDISPVVVHIPYIINLATPDKALYTKSINAYIEDIRRADELGAEYFVTHLGSHVGSGEGRGIRAFASALKAIIKKAKPRTTILLENTAGSGSCIGYRFEHIKSIMDKAGAGGRVGVCLDTAHTFEAGYDIRTARGLRSTLSDVDRLLGLENVKVVHFNDSLSEANSRVDRHQHLGKGGIGSAALSRVINHPGFKHAAFILETPKKTDRDDRRNLEMANKLVK